MVSRRILTLVLAICLTLALAVPAAAVTIEQVNAEPPEFSIYLYEPGADLGSIRPSDVTVSYDGQSTMEVTGFQRASDTGVSVLYIYALDVSASIPKAVFDASREAVLEAYGKLGANEELALITFGDTVDTKLAGGEGRDQVEAVLASLSPKDMNTDFYGAVDRIVELSKLHGAGRKIGVIFSDGVDDIYAGLTRNELEAKLRSNGVSINAMCLNGVSSDIASQFGEFARLSGGELYLFDSKNASEKLSELLDRVNGCYVLTLKSQTNITDGLTHAIRFELGNLPAEVVEVAPATWIADNTPPKITEIVYDGDVTITVKFSERVSNAQLYTLETVEGTSLRSNSALSGEDTVILTLEKVPYEGEYTLTFSEVADVSMEENPLETKSITFTLETGVKEFPRWAYYAIGGGVLLLIIIIILIVALRGKRKRQETDERFTHLENQPVITGQGEQVGNQIVIPKARGIRVQLDIFDGRGKKYSVSPDIVTSLFIGKHAGNDLVLEDSRVSRQHAVIEKLESAIAIQDLNSTNGTFVNGAKIQPEVSQRIAAGDELTLGDTTIRIISVN